MARSPRETLAAVASGVLPRYVARVAPARFFPPGHFAPPHLRHVSAVDLLDLTELSPLDALLEAGWSLDALEAYAGDDVLLLVLDTDPDDAPPPHPTVRPLTWDTLAACAFDDFFLHQLGKLTAVPLEELFAIAARTPVGGEPDSPSERDALRALRQSLPSVGLLERTSGVSVVVREDGSVGARELLITNNGTGFRLEAGVNGLIQPLGPLTL